MNYTGKPQRRKSPWNRLSERSESHTGAAGRNTSPISRTAYAFSSHWNAASRIAPNLPVFNMTTFEQQLDSSLGQTRRAATLSGGFGVLALILAGNGVYGVTAFAVTTQTKAIGIRLALGASPRHI